MMLSKGTKNKAMLPAKPISPKMMYVLRLPMRLAIVGKKAAAIVMNTAVIIDV